MFSLMTLLSAAFDLDGIIGGLSVIGICVLCGAAGAALCLLTYCLVYTLVSLLSKLFRKDK